MSDKIELKFNQDGIYLVARISGVITLETRDEFRQEIESEIKKHPVSCLIIDLAGVTLIDSSGLGSIFSLYKILTENKSRLSLAAPKNDVASLIELTHLDKVIQVTKSVAEITG